MYEKYLYLSWKLAATSGFQLKLQISTFYLIKLLIFKNRVKVIIAAIRKLRFKIRQDIRELSIINLWV